MNKYITVYGANKNIIWKKNILAKHAEIIDGGTIAHAGNSFTFAFIERDYWLDIKTDKVRYSSTVGGQRSYKHLFNVYMEVAKDQYAYCGNCTENSKYDVIRRKVKYFKALDKQTITDFLKSAVQY